VARREIVTSRVPNIRAKKVGVLLSRTTCAALGVVVATAENRSAGASAGSSEYLPFWTVLMVTARGNPDPFTTPFARASASAGTAAAASAAASAMPCKRRVSS
jgi:hypothetical protein